MMLKKMSQHPYDLDYTEIEKHKVETYKVKQSGIIDCDTNAEATLEVICKNLQSKMPKDTFSASDWQEFLDQFEENDLQSKKTFNEFLGMLQKESFYREMLAETFIFKQSAERLVIQEDVQLLTLQHQKIIQEYKIKHDEHDIANMKLPALSYQIKNLLIFQFHGVLLLLLTNDRGDCQLFEYESGIQVHEFQFEQSGRPQSPENSNNKEAKSGSSPEKAKKNSSPSSLSNVPMILSSKQLEKKPESGQISIMSKIAEAPERQEEANSDGLFSKKKAINAAESQMNITIKKTQFPQNSLFGSNNRQKRSSKQLEMQRISSKETNTLTQKKKLTNQTSFLQTNSLNEKDIAKIRKEQITQFKEAGSQKDISSLLETTSFKRMRTKTMSLPPRASRNQRQNSFASQNRQNSNPDQDEIKSKFGQQVRPQSRLAAEQQFQTNRSITKFNDIVDPREQDRLKRLRNMSAAKVAAKGYRERNAIQGVNKVENLTLGHNYNIFDPDDIYEMKPSAADQAAAGGQDQNGQNNNPGAAQRRAQSTKAAQSNMHDILRQEWAQDCDNEQQDRMSTTVIQKALKGQLFIRSKAPKNLPVEDRLKMTDQVLFRSLAERRERNKRQRYSKDRQQAELHDQIFDLNSLDQNYKQFQKTMTQRNLKDKEFESTRRLLSAQNQNFQSILGSSMGKRNAMNSTSTSSHHNNQGNNLALLQMQQSSAAAASAQNTSAINRDESNRSLGTVSGENDGNQLRKIGSAASNQKNPTIQRKRSSSRVMMSVTNQQQSRRFAASSQNGSPSNTVQQSKQSNETSNVRQHNAMLNNSQQSQQQPYHHQRSKSSRLSAYVPLSKRPKQIVTEGPLSRERFKKRLDLLYNQPRPIEDIKEGMRRDQQKISDALDVDQLINRVMKKENDAIKKYMDAQEELMNQNRIQTGENSGAQESEKKKMPTIDRVNLMEYEETVEEKKKYRRDYHRHYTQKDVTIQQLLREHKASKEAQNVKKKKVVLGAVKKADQEQKTSSQQPMVMAHFQKDHLNLVIFALASKELKLMQIRPNGQKKSFNSVASKQLEYLPTGLDCGTHKSRKTLIVCVTMQAIVTGGGIIGGQGKDSASKDELCLIKVLEFDQFNGFKCKELETIRPRRPQVSKILYKKNYGLIMACFRGYIEVFDNNKFRPSLVWDSMKVTRKGLPIASQKLLDSKESKAKVQGGQQLNNDLSEIGGDSMEPGQIDDWVLEEVQRKREAQRQYARQLAKEQNEGVELGANGTRLDSENNNLLNNQQIGSSDPWNLPQKEQPSSFHNQPQQFDQSNQHHHHLGFVEDDLQSLNSERLGTTESARGGAGANGAHKLSVNQQGAKDADLQKLAMIKASLRRKAGKDHMIATINTCDYSAELDLIAFGGVHGQIGLIDSSTMSFIGMYEAHQGEVSQLYFNKKELQMISVSNDGEVALWDAQKMSILQVIKNKTNMKVKNISTSAFNPKFGLLLLATSKVFRYAMQEDSQARIQLDQQLSLSTNYIQKLKVNALRQGLITEDSESTQARTPTASEKQKTTSDEDQQSDKKVEENESLKESRIMKEIFDYRNASQFQKASQNLTKGELLVHDSGSYSVLPSHKTKLVAFFVKKSSRVLFTLDTDRMIRQWDLTRGRCKKSYPLELPMQQEFFGAACTTNSGSSDADQYKIQNAAVSCNKKVILVSFQSGLLQLNNLHSGAVIFNKSLESMIDIGPQEIANIKFFPESAKSWAVATCWDGKVAFIQKPLTLTSSEDVKATKVDSRHKRDVTCIDISNKKQMVTGSIDNMLVFWNTYNGKENKFIKLPKSVANQQNGESIQQIKYASKESQEFLFVVISTGDFYIIETQREKFVEPADFELGTKVLPALSFGRVPKYAIIDIKRAGRRPNDDKSLLDRLLVLAVDESGRYGTLHEVLMHIHLENGTQKVRHLANVKKSFSMELLSQFQIEKPPMGGPKNSIAQIANIKLIPAKNLFIIALTSGIISMYSIDEQQFVAFLNQPKWNSSIFGSYSGGKLEQRAQKEVRNDKNYVDSSSDEDLDLAHRNLAKELSLTLTQAEMDQDIKSAGIASPRSLEWAAMQEEKRLQQNLDPLLSMQDREDSLLENSDKKVKADQEQQKYEEERFVRKKHRGGQENNTTTNHASTRNRQAQFNTTRGQLGQSQAHNTSLLSPTAAQAVAGILASEQGDLGHQQSDSNRGGVVGGTNAFSAKNHNSTNRQLASTKAFTSPRASSNN